MTLNAPAAPARLEAFQRELAHGLESQALTGPVEIVAVSENPRILALAVEPEGFPTEGTLRDLDLDLDQDLDRAVTVNPGTTPESVALDIAVCDIAEPGPVGIPWEASGLEQISRRWPEIGWRGGLDLFSSI